MTETMGEKVIVALNQKFPAMKSLYRVKRIGIFGPLARDEGDPAVPPDIEVEFEAEGDTARNFLALSGYLEDLHGCRVNLVTRRLVEDLLEDQGGCREEQFRNGSALSRMGAEMSFLLARQKGLDFRTFSTDEVLRRAVIRSLETLGECALQVSAEFRQVHPEVPWTELAGLRTSFIHPSFGPDWVLVWDFLTSELPGIASRIWRLLDSC